MIDQFQNFYQSLETREKFTFVSATFLVIIALIGVLFWANSTTYKSVYTSNDSARIRSATSALESAGIPYRVSDDGFQVSVPTEHMGQARITTAGVSTVSGMEVLGTMKLGASPQQERWTYLAALQGELTKTINSLDEVAASRVHIVEADKSAFLKRDEQSSASVTVRLHPGQELSASQIQGITSLVAGAVPRLKPSQVVLVDETGALLHGPSEEDQNGAVAKTLMDARQQHESRYKKTILDHLGRILGSISDVSVAVTVDVVSASSETKKHSFDPNSQVTISETIKESSSKEATPVGYPGTTPQLPESAPDDTESSSDEKFQSATNYDYTTVSELTVLAPGSPKRVSASVLVNSLALQKMVDASAGEVELSDLKQQIRAAVEAAVGVSAERQDVVKVEYVPFTPLSTDSTLVVATTDWEAYINYALILLVILLLFFGVIRPIMSTYTQTVLAEEENVKKAGELEGMETEEGSSVALAKKLRQMVDNFETVNSEDLSRLVEMHEQPSAEVIRRWLRAST